jgi:hypothetical protein
MVSRVERRNPEIRVRHHKDVTDWHVRNVRTHGGPAGGLVGRSGVESKP